MKRNRVIIALTAVLLVILSLLVIHLHSISKRAVVSRIQEYQLLHAHHFAEQIETFVWGHARGLFPLTFLLFSDRDGINRVKAEIDDYSREMQKDHIREVFICDDTGRVVYSTDGNSVGLNHGQSDFFTWAKEEGKRGEVFVSPLPVNRNSLLFHISTPLYRGPTGPKDPKKGEVFAGLVSLTLDLKEFLTHELKEEEEKVSLRQMWIMDQQGNLLFHTEHPEMMLRNIHQREESCKSCHISFGYTEKILKDKRGTVDYQLRNASKKLAAFSTAQFGNISWTVVVNFPYDRATAFATKSLREHLILLGLVVLAFIIGSILILRNSRLKEQAQAEALRFQEKISERKKAEEALAAERNNFKGILDNLQDGISIVDKECDIQYINPVIKKEFGPTNGRKCHDYFHDFPQVCSWCKNKTAFNGGLAQWECYFQKNGKTYEITEVPVFQSGGIVSKLEILHDITERKRVEGAMHELERQRRHLSFQLLMAQEAERRRISRELHDELGGALAVFKLRFSHLEKNLQKDQIGLKEECRNNLKYVDQVIENVHRLSRDLSPSILEDLGLSSALRWLISNFGKNYNTTKIISDVTDIDHLFPPDTQIVVYRIVQEALTNIGKHAQAKNVSLVVKREDGMISFSVEDDGKGFDVKKAMMKEAGEKGLGLPSMEERARMLGGSLDVWSEEGKGTRITLRIPTGKGESV